MSKPIPIEDQRDFDGNPISGEVVVHKSKAVDFQSVTGKVSLTPEEARQFSYDELVKTLGEATTASEAIGSDQFGPILSDKMVLLGVPFVIVHWNFYQGDMGEFASFWILTEAGDRYIVNDGGTGVYAQLRELTDSKGIDSMLGCPHGLRVSEYDYELPNGKSGRAKTFYIDTKL